ncbi:MAG: hypothetical protein LWX11_00455 [Firmicutes bacterium]|nr:hypothetical protein [Bacillota bacterium]
MRYILPCLLSAFLALPLSAQNRMQFGFHAGAVSFSGAALDGLPKTFAWIGGQVRFDLREGHVLQAALGGTRMEARPTQVFHLDAGYHYEAPLSISMNSTQVQLSAEYHYFPSQVMGQGFHGFCGLGLAHSNVVKELPEHFDIPRTTEHSALNPLVTVGFGYHFTRAIGVSLRMSSFQSAFIGTQVDPVKGQLNQGMSQVTLVTLTTSFYFR